MTNLILLSVFIACAFFNSCGKLEPPSVKVNMESVNLIVKQEAPQIKIIGNSATYHAMSTDMDVVLVEVKQGDGYQYLHLTSVGEGMAEVTVTDGCNFAKVKVTVTS